MKQRLATQQEINLIAKGLVIRENISCDITKIAYEDYLKDEESIKEEVRKRFKEHLAKDSVNPEECMDIIDDNIITIAETSCGYKLASINFFAEDEFVDEKTFFFGYDKAILFDSGEAFLIPKDWDFISENTTEEYMLEDLWSL
jgi:hypothetical protein